MPINTYMRFCSASDVLLSIAVMIFRARLVSALRAYHANVWEALGSPPGLASSNFLSSLDFKLRHSSFSSLTGICGGTMCPSAGKNIGPL